MAHNLKTTTIIANQTTALIPEQLSPLKMIEIEMMIYNNEKLTN